MYLDSGDKTLCCGCTACANICPLSAIHMKQDERGFFHPVIDKEKCVSCGLCRKVCDFSSLEPGDHTVLATYGMYHKDAAVRKKSRSGGAFYMLAQSVIDLGGSVWGAAFDKSLEVVHKSVEDHAGLVELQGSKYVQSQMGDSFSKIGKELSNGRYVLFSGTACQVAGLFGFLRESQCNTTKLITCDIVCQGVPSPQIYRDYRNYLEDQHNAKLVEFQFRDPTRIGWEGHEESYRFAHDRKTHYSRKYTNYYYAKLLRESCYVCKYAGVHRPGDFSLGDFWGVKESYPEHAAENGTSVILVNTEKGNAFLEKAKTNGNLFPVELERCLQPRLCSPSQKPDGYEAFWQSYKEKGPYWCIANYGKESLKSKLVYTIKPLLRKIKKG